MGKTGSKPGHVFKAVCISMLIGISAMLWEYSGTQSLKFKNLLSLDGDTSDTIILLHERFRVRAIFDIAKRTTFNTGGIPNHNMDFQTIKHVELKSLFVNAYQRNVFYVYASFSVP